MRRETLQHRGLHAEGRPHAAASRAPEVAAQPRGGHAPQVPQHCTRQQGRITAVASQRDTALAAGPLEQVQHDRRQRFTGRFHRPRVAFPPVEEPIVVHRHVLDGDAKTPRHHPRIVPLPVGNQSIVDSRHGEALGRRHDLAGECGNGGRIKPAAHEDRDPLGTRALAHRRGHRVAIVLDVLTRVPVAQRLRHRQLPVPPHIGRATGTARQGMGGRHPGHAGKACRGGVLRMPEQQKVTHRLVGQARRDTVIAAQGRQAVAQEEHARRRGLEKRLHAEAVSSRPQHALPGVPEADREVAVEAVGARTAPDAVRPRHKSGVGRALRGAPQTSPEFGLHGAAIVEPTVEHDVNAVVLRVWPIVGMQRRGRQPDAAADPRDPGPRRQTTRSPGQAVER